MSKPAPRTAPSPRRAAPKAAAADERAPKLGDCLRAIRFERRMSLADVSAATGISRSTLSRVETDQLSLTYDKLVQLSRGLGIDLAELLSPRDEPAQRPALTRRAVAGPDEGRVLTVGTSVYRYMCTELSAKRMTPMVAEVRARSVAESNGLSAHPGEEFTYVLGGTVELHTEFYEPVTLGKGGCVYFDSTMRHTYVAVGDAPAQILCVCSVDDFTNHHASANPPDAHAAAAAPASLAAKPRAARPARRPRAPRIRDR